MPVDRQDLSRRLFAAANQLWTDTALRPDQYAQPVLALPEEPYPQEVWDGKVEAVWQFVYAHGAGRLGEGAALH
jgi:hypothetical protein